MSGLIFHFLLNAALLFAMFALREILKWIEHFYGRLTIENIFYNLMFGVDGQRNTDTSMLSYVKANCLVKPIPFAVAGAFVLLVVSYGAAEGYGIALSAFISTALALGLVAQILWLFLVDLALVKFLRQSRRPNITDTLYVEPRDVQITPGRQKNLIMIYVESLEASYRNPDLFGKNLLLEIDNLGGKSFERFINLPGIDATTSATIASLGGIPFVPNVKAAWSYNAPLITGKKDQVRFLPNALLLGDVLKASGYTNLHMQGAHSQFHGLSQLFRDHGYRAISAETLLPIVRPQRKNGWGLHDDDLFDAAFTYLEDLAKNSTPYSLTMQTADMHGPNGFYSPRHLRAYGGRRDYANVVEYTATLIANFVRKAAQNGLLENTCIVIMGDHFSGRTPYHAKLENDPKRSIYNRFLSSDGVQLARSEINHFDIFPTVLELMGFTIEGGKLGLGTSAMGPAQTGDIRTHAQDWSGERAQTLKNRSKILNGLWTRR